MENASKNYEYVLLMPEFGTFGPSLVVAVRGRILSAYSLWSDPTRCCSWFTVGLGSRGRTVSLSGYRERDGTKSNSQKKLHNDTAAKRSLMCWFIWVAIMPET